MSTNTNGKREAVSAGSYLDGEFLGNTDWVLSPITHTMGAPSPIFSTMPSPVYATLLAPESGAAATVVSITTSTTASTEPPPSDPLFEDQWHFDRLGDIQKIWEEYTGVGVHHGVYEDGVESTHPDLAPNYDADSELTVQGEHLDPLLYASVGYPHGTAVSGLIAAARNGEGVVGVAYGSTITGVPMFAGITDINNNFEGFMEALYHASDFDVVNNSWGNTPAFWQDLLTENDAINAGWLHAVEEGRDGLGTIVVKAAGNDNLNSNGDGNDTTRVTIIVGAYDFTGDASWYSSYGANLLVSAPSSGDMRGFFSPPGPPMIDPGLVTTDLTGLSGYNKGVFLEGEDYTNQFGGTSGATPIVSGVVALMLDANENLGWRDVQTILAYSAREVGSGIGGTPTDSENYKWFYNNASNWNGGGLHFSQDYGFGAVDAYNAVRMAEVWGLFAAPQTSVNESSYSSSMTTPTSIGDLKNTDITFTFGDVSSFDVEYVNVDLVIEHPSTSPYIELNLGSVHSNFPRHLADLTVELISPDGTVVELVDFGKEIAIDGGQLHISLGANAFRGEDASGEWTLRIADHWFDNNGPGTLTSATVTLHGRDGDSGGNDLTDDVYHYTNEVFTTLGRDASRQTLTDGNGGDDWLNMAAMSSSLAVNLAAGATSTAAGLAFLTITSGTEIENAVTGDGNDSLTGNGLGNKLYGMRGSDTIDGGAGDDTLSGGAGNDMLTGGIGLDFFLFDRALNAMTNVDIITDFSHADDAIWLDATIFAGLSIGTLDAGAFYVGAAAEDELDRIIYDSLTGALYFDADGSGALAALQFGTLTGSPDDLTFEDFVIVSSAVGAIVAGNDFSASTGPTVDNTTDAERRGAGTVFGTSDHEQIRADDGDNKIFGLDGEDIIFAGEGNNTVDGGAAVDTIFSGSGNDVLMGGGSYDVYGDNIYAGGGDDLIIGSDNQVNDDAWRLAFFGRGDTLSGEAGNDEIYGLNGDDRLSGGDGNDLLVGGNGSDSLDGGAGDDRLIAGTGEINQAFGGSGFDTLVLQGPSSEYRYFIVDIRDGFALSGLVLAERVSEGVTERVAFAPDVERLEFSDGTTLDFDQPLIVRKIHPSPFDLQTYEDVNVEVDGYEIGAYIKKAASVTVTDTGAESGASDKLQAVYVERAYGDVDISSDALGMLSLSALGKHYFSGGWHHEPMMGSVSVHAAEGERDLTLELSGVFLGETGKIIDDTATSVRLLSGTAASSMDYPDGDHLNGAAVNDFNLSFESATKITFANFYGAKIKWYIPNVTTIEMPFTQFSPIVHETYFGNAGRLVIETALDDELLATAGGSEAYSFTTAGNGFGQLASYGKEFIRFGNLGDVNMSNDGTVGEEAGTNAGLGLRGTINLGFGDDEARILGTGAFQGGHLDAGISVNPDDPNSVSEVNGDTIRMTFGVAAAIGNISDDISNFEILQLDTPTLTGQVVDVANFDSLSKVAITGGTTSGGDNTVIGLLGNSVVTLRSVTDGIQEVPEDFGGGFHVFDTFGSEFGTIHLDMAGDGDDDTLTLNFVGLETDGKDQGTIHVLDAETVNITTSSRDTAYHTAPFNPNVFNPPLAFEPTNAFGQVLDLDATTTITLSGNTGWDFTVEGTDISHVTLIDASGINDEDIAFYGAVGAVKAIAQTSEGVTFIGGWGDDEFTGGAGNDTLAGGERGNDLLDGAAGLDKAVFAGSWSDYTITVGDDGVVTLASNIDGSVDTVKNMEVFKFADKLVTADNLLTGIGNSAPEDIALSNAAIAEFADDGTVVGLLTATDPDTGETFTYELVDDAGGRFAIVGDKLVVADSAALDFEIDAAHEVKVKVTDSAGLSVEKTFTVAVTDVNEKAGVSLVNTTASIAENTPTTSRIKVADIVLSDDARGTNKLSLVGRDAGLFEIVGMALFLKAGAQLDFSKRQSLEVAVAVDDDEIAGNPDAVSATYTLAVADVAGLKMIHGTSGNNTLSGTNGNDHFDGHGGRDTFKGYRGNDTYVVDSRDDKVVESRGQGTDSVLSTVSYALGSHVENLALLGDASIDGTGNSGNNVITGNAGNNRLYGGSGNDTIEGGIGDDYMDGGKGTDTASYEHASSGVTVSLAVYGPQFTGDSTGTDTLKGFQNLKGSAHDDWLTGNDGDNVLDGGAGADHMAGGKDDDTYIVDHVNDVIHEAARHGTDTVKSSVSFTLSANVENLTLTGSNAINGTGNELANKITGNDAANKLAGGAGKDWLKGGGGHDSFVFNTALSSKSNRDTIADYKVADDTIELDNAIFTALFGAEGSVLSADQFWKGTAAHDASDRIIYNSKTGVLIYDSNGNAHGGAVEIAVLSKGLAMTNAEFVIV